MATKLRFNWPFELRRRADEPDGQSQEDAYALTDPRHVADDFKLKYKKCQQPGVGAMGFAWTSLNLAKFSIFNSAFVPPQMFKPISANGSFQKQYVKIVGTDTATGTVYGQPLRDDRTGGSHYGVTYGVLNNYPFRRSVSGGQIT